MRRSLILIVVGCLLATALVAGVVTRAAGADTLPVRAPAVADTVYTNGVVDTEDAAHTTAQAIAVKDGKIVFVGDDAGAPAYVGAGTTSVDLAGRFMPPGFIDSHAHPDSALVGPLRGQHLQPPRQHAVLPDEDPRLRRQASGPHIIQGGGWDSTILPVIGPTATSSMRPSRTAPPCSGT